MGNGANIIIASSESVVRHEKDEHACPYHAAPIHISRRRAWSSWEELKEPEVCKEAEGYDVDRDAGFARVESRGESVPLESRLWSIPRARKSKYRLPKVEFNSIKHLLQMM